MSIDCFTFDRFLSGLRSGTGGYGELHFEDREISLDGVEYEVEAEYTIQNYTERLTHQIDIDGEHEVSFDLETSVVVDAALVDNEATALVACILSHLDDGQAFDVIRALVEWRMEKNEEEGFSWSALHSALTTVKAETAETVSDVTVVEVQEADPEPAPEPVTEVAPAVTSPSVKETVKSILEDENDRLLLIGLLVESGYIVGKKVV
jgi:hypothetical protein